jgi:hypothetical protein
MVNGETASGLTTILFTLTYLGLALGKVPGLHGPSRSTTLKHPGGGQERANRGRLHGTPKTPARSWMP